ncbi:hypothetical protein C0992_007260 [Termitomyces sp. T32_za158]|nr:hypothetical protein C0992_007260 [Termitomyces sp. T32_za158]
MLVTLAGLPFEAKFDTTSPISQIPGHLFTTSVPSVARVLTLPVDLREAGVDFSTVLKFEAANVPVVVLGRGWFALYREHLLLSGSTPATFDDLLASAGVMCATATSSYTPALLDESYSLDDKGQVR